MRVTIDWEDGQRKPVELFFDKAGVEFTLTYDIKPHYDGFEPVAMEYTGKKNLELRVKEF